MCTKWPAFAKVCAVRVFVVNYMVLLHTGEEEALSVSGGNATVTTAGNPCPNDADIGQYRSPSGEIQQSIAITTSWPTGSTVSADWINNVCRT